MANYYIATTGNDSTGAGTFASPWLTLSKALTSSTTGDTIYVAAGTYTFSSLTFSSSRNIVGSSVFDSNGLPTVIFDGAAAANPIWTIAGGTISNIIIQNIVHVANNAFPIQVNATLVTFINCVFRTMTLYSNGNIGSTIISAGGSGYTVTLIGCLFYNNITTTQFVSGVFGYGGGFDPIVFLYNCIIAATSSVGSRVTGRHASSSTQLTAKNCIFYSSFSLAWHGVSTAPTWTANCSNNTVYGYTSAPTNVTAIAPITSDPLFTNAINGDFRLRPTSPCIDAGILT